MGNSTELRFMLQSFLPTDMFHKAEAYVAVASPPSIIHGMVSHGLPLRFSRFPHSLNSRLLPTHQIEVGSSEEENTSTSFLFC